MTKQIVYTSQPTRSFSNDDLAGLLSGARQHNQDHNITGFLLYDGREFVQLLEGPAAEIEALLARIKADKRHDNVQVIVDTEEDTTYFAEWSMAYSFLEGDSLQRFGGSMSDASATAIAELISTKKSTALRMIGDMLETVSDPVRLAEAG